MSEEQDREEDKSKILDPSMDMFAPIPEGTDPRYALAEISYNLIRFGIKRFEETQKSAKFSNQSYKVKMEDTIGAINGLIDSIKKAEESFRMSDNWDTMKKQIDDLRYQIEFAGKVNLITPEIKAQFVKKLDKAESEVDKSKEIDHS